MFQNKDACSFSLSAPALTPVLGIKGVLLALVSLCCRGMNFYICLCVCTLVYTSVYSFAHLYVCMSTLASLCAYQGSLLLTLSSVTIQCEPQILPDSAHSF